MISCYQDTMQDCIQEIESFYVFKNEKKIKISNADRSKFNMILKNINEILHQSRLMPAFGVSLHNETLNALEKDTWLQINFNKEMEKNGLLFNSLVFKLELTSGINLIRLYNGKYEGRCFYLDLIQPIDLNCILNLNENIS
ncbi:MAG: hypothetical protein IJW36_01850 [Clostridia bacterium]|nr:hypothetical protein [Clostridia bacterium]